MYVLSAIRFVWLERKDPVPHYQKLTMFFYWRSASVIAGDEGSKNKLHLEPMFRIVRLNKRDHF